MRNKNAKVIKKSIKKDNAISKEDNEHYKIKDIVLRYTFLLIVGCLGVNLFYSLFSPLTITFVYEFLSNFFRATLSQNVITIGDNSIEIIDACIAGAGYYLFLILSFSVSNISLLKRMVICGFCWVSFFFINILRIVLLSLLFFSGNSYFDIMHNLFWFFGSTLFVVGIWFLAVKIFEIKSIPFYSDFLYLLNNSSFKKQ